MKRKGFTFVELLIVIGIIALLVAIIFPTLTQNQTIAGKVLEKKSVVNYRGWAEPRVVIEISPHNTMEVNCNGYEDEITPGIWYTFNVRGKHYITGVQRTNPPPSQE